MRALDLEREIVEISGVSLTGGSLLAAVIALVATYVAAVLISRAIKRVDRRNETTSASLYTVSRLTQYSLIVVGILIALNILGIPLRQLTLLAGAIGIGLGFGLQTIFNNFLSGLILLFDRSLRVGDFVELESGVTGEVRAINIRATLLVTNDNIDILVPNSEFVGGRVTNWTHGEKTRRMRVPFGVAYGTNKDKVKRAALEAAHSVPFGLPANGPRQPQVWLVGFGESSLDYELVVWLTDEATKRPLAVRAAYNWALHTSLAKYGLEIPFPQRDIHLRSVFELRDTEAMAALGLPGGDRKRPSVAPAEVDEAPEPGSDNDAAGEVVDGV